MPTLSSQSEIRELRYDLDHLRVALYHAIDDERAARQQLARDVLARLDELCTRLSRAETRAAQHSV